MPISDWDPTPQPSPPRKAPAQSTKRNIKICGRDYEPWQSWHDRELVKTLLNVRPFVAAHGKADAAWQTVVDQLRAAGIKRSAAAAKMRFKALRKIASKADTRAAQATGTNEEVNSFVEVRRRLFAFTSLTAIRT